MTAIIERNGKTMHKANAVGSILAMTNNCRLVLIFDLKIQVVSNVERLDLTCTINSSADPIYLLK
jgi:hypothetical protein